MHGTVDAERCVVQLLSMDCTEHRYGSSFFSKRIFCSCTAPLTCNAKQHRCHGVLMVWRMNTVITKVVMRWHETLIPGKLFVCATLPALAVLQPAMLEVRVYDCSCNSGSLAAMCVLCCCCVHVPNESMLRQQMNTQQVKAQSMSGVPALL
jgi:hypothetical protein